MGEIAEKVKEIIAKFKTDIERGEAFEKISREINSSLFDLGEEAENKELIVTSFFWVAIPVPASAIIGHEMTKIGPEILKEDLNIKGDHELAGDLFKLLRSRMEKIEYSDLINLGSGEVRLQEIGKAFGIRDLELPLKEKSLIILTIANRLVEAWKKGNVVVNRLVMEQISKLDDKLKSVENDEQAVAELKKVSEEILYTLHLKAMGE